MTDTEPTALADYKALVEDARAYVAPERWRQDALADAVESLLAIEQRLTDHIVQLAAERDALAVENPQLRADRDTLVRRLVGPWTVVPEGGSLMDGHEPDWYDTHCPTCDAPEPTHTPMCAVVPEGEQP